MKKMDTIIAIVLMLCFSVIGIMLGVYSGEEGIKLRDDQLIQLESQLNSLQQQIKVLEDSNNVYELYCTVQFERDEIKNEILRFRKGEGE